VKPAPEAKPTSTIPRGKPVVGMPEGKTTLDGRPLPPEYKPGLDALAAKDWPAAEAAFRTALSSDDSRADGHYRLGVALAAQGKLDEAIASFEAALLRAPRDPRPREAIERARTAQDKRAPAPPPTGAALLLRARVHFDARRTVIARGLLDQLLAAPPADLTPPDSAEAYLLRGQARAALHDLAGAADDYLRALALAPARATPLRLLGQTYVLAKDDARALAYFQTYLERAKSDPAEIDHIADVRQHVATLSKQK